MLCRRRWRGRVIAMILSCAMYQKFIITADGVLKFGKVYHHRDLLGHDEACLYGGGLWRIDEARKAVLLFGRSFEFGTPEFSRLTYVNRSGIGEVDYPLFYQEYWPYDERLVPVGIGL